MVNAQKNGQKHYILLFTGRDESDLDNDRGITFLDILGKLFLGILFERLTIYLVISKIGMKIESTLTLHITESKRGICIYTNLLLHFSQQ